MTRFECRVLLKRVKRDDGDLDTLYKREPSLTEKTLIIVPLRLAVKTRLQQTITMRNTRYKKYDGGRAA
jgi:hypothetical protein